MIPPFLLQILGTSPPQQPDRYRVTIAPAEGLSIFAPLDLSGSSFVLQAPSMERRLRDIIRISPRREQPYFAPLGPPSDHPLPWSEIPERSWVPGVMSLLHLIRAIDFEGYDVPSNVGQQGCRPSEFQVDGTVQRGRASVCWETQTLANVVARTRMDRLLNEPGIYDFHVHYTNYPLDVSGRTPLNLGPWFLNVRGFYFLMGGQLVPNREEYDPMDPPYVPMDASYARCRNREECVATLRYDFEGVVSPVVRNNEASTIVGFWNSLGFGRDFYRMTGLPAGSVSMRVYDFMEQIVRPLLSPERRDFLERSVETWSENPPLLSWSQMGGLGLRLLMNPGDVHINTSPEDSYGVHLMEQREVRSLLDARLALLRNEWSAGVSGPEASVLQARIAYFERLRRNYTSQSNINFIQLVSRGRGSPVLNERGEPVMQNGAVRRLDDNRSYLHLSAPALDFNINLGEQDHHATIRLEHVLANEIRMSGPSLNEIFSSQRWSNHIPIRITLVSPYIQNLSFNRGGLRIRLPEVRADEITITLPSLADLAEKLHIGPNHPFEMGELVEHWQEWLPYCRLEARNLRVDGRFEVAYDKYHLTVNGNSGVINRISLSTDPPDHMQDAQHANRRIPHLRINRGIIDQAHLQWGSLGGLQVEGRGNLEDFNVTFPYDHIVVRSPRIGFQGTVVYNAEDPSRSSQTQNHQETSFPRPTLVRFGEVRNNELGNQQITFSNIAANFTHSGQNSGRLNLDVDIFANILPGTAVFPMGFQSGRSMVDSSSHTGSEVRLQRGNINGAHLQTWIHFPYVNGHDSFQHRTIVSGDVTLEFSGELPYRNRQNTFSIMGNLEHVVAQSRNACIFFTGNDPNHDENIGHNYGDSIYIDSQSMVQGACSIYDIRLPEQNQPIRRAQAQVPIEVHGNLVGMEMLLRGIPMIGFLNHHRLNGNLSLNLEQLVRRGDHTEVDLSHVNLSELSGNVEVAGRTLIFVPPNPSHNTYTTLPSSSDHNNNVIGANRIRVQGHEEQISPSRRRNSQMEETRWQLDQLMLLGLNISLRDRSAERNRLTLHSPHVAVYNGQVSFNLNQGFLEIIYPGLPRLLLGNPISH